MAIGQPHCILTEHPSRSSEFDTGISSSDRSELKESLKVIWSNDTPATDQYWNALSHSTPAATD
jgi:hypothetical protein